MVMISCLRIFDIDAYVFRFLWGVGCAYILNALGYFVGAWFFCGICGLTAVRVCLNAILLTCVWVYFVFRCSGVCLR